MQKRNKLIELETESDTESDFDNDLSNQLENFFFYLTEGDILEVFQKFRECENKKDSRIPNKEFRRHFNSQWTSCGRSSSTSTTPSSKSSTGGSSSSRRPRYFDQVINMYDFLTSLTVFLKLENLQKISILMILMDVDEDYCLSILEIKKMLRTVLVVLGSIYSV